MPWPEGIPDGMAVSDGILDWEDCCKEVAAPGPVMGEAAKDWEVETDSKRAAARNITRVDCIYIPI